ncbi:class I SAM-dependent methyltransferase [Mycolicibacterium sediminis]|uniref:S-adenosyl-L-methionine-dependent methyltransferase n=1 Tax=Mycolicibacterium sediminis TaxID=1286180 RepID=A0A7I7QNM5_9MYCO|nr:class I SAM-dependent methyltransferase [Mycolicibacterium sediminis]BBY27620.1 putative S-adenosyl-L-methionine-dependent methyltransferase [Mycolicibacterium sediminis]
MRPHGDDRDTWDITTSVGSTALYVAAARALEAQKPDALAVDPFAEVFCRAVGGDWADVLDPAAGDGTGQGVFGLRSDFGGHFVSFQGARTRYFDAYFARAADAGVDQIVVLAAGLDSRAYRLPWRDGTRVYELDQPQVLDFKRQVLASNGAEPRAERREVAIDLRDDWPAALRDAGFDPTRPSAWIAEGLLIYLPASAQEQLFAGIDDLACPGSWVAVEEGRPMPDEMFRAKQQEERDAGEDGSFFTLVYNEQTAPAQEWFTRHGWDADTTALPDHLARLGRPVAAEDSEAGPMLASISLVTARKV